MQLRDWTEEGFWWGSLSKRFEVADREGHECLARPSIRGLVSLILSQLTERVACEGLLGPFVLVTSFPGEKRGSLGPQCGPDELFCSSQHLPSLETPRAFLWPQLGGRKLLLNLSGKLVAKS